MTTSDSNQLLYVKDARIWIPSPVNVWEQATLFQNYKTGDRELQVIKGSGGEVSSIKLNSEKDLPPLCNPSILVGQNDLVALSYLHEPAVLHNLEIRFRQRQTIYTYCGIVLVAINPYADIPLYGPDIIRAYRGHAMGELEPHIFAVAEEAYAKLEREKCDLSIIVSGESGAGKTVSAKYAMRYFAAVGGSDCETKIEKKVLSSSPIMEAIGNAKTTRNDNSSRFGKFTKLLFRNEMDVMALTGASMQTYLLEKSRVVFQAAGERNYHIFYQLCAAREQYPSLLLGHQNKFKYLNMGNSPEINNISDCKQFTETIEAFHVLGFSTQEITDIINILAGILHLGNIQFTTRYKRNSEEIDHEGCDIMSNDLNLRIVGEILKVNSSNLRKWLVTRQIESVNETVLIPNNAAAAEATKDALAKHIYAKLFQYIVSVINKSLNSGTNENCFIGVLDIYGFETFDINSFEQFCINYANEKLQQQFNQHVFKLEQDQYLKEGIVWTMIDFYDNQPCIDLIESKLGILDLLDEECKMPQGSDDSWGGKLVEKCIKYKQFEKPRFGKSSFVVKHFSDAVQYEVIGFLEKNRDTVSKELVNLIRESDMTLCKKLMELEEISTSNEKTLPSGVRVVVSPSKPQIIPSKQHKQSVGSQFRESLKSLITTLHATTPHYVRCIKPNEQKAAFTWEAAKIVQQLRACGVLETVRISAAGFPSRWSYHDFYNRYQLLCNISLLTKTDTKTSCKHIVTKWLMDDDKYRFGNTQIFFRAGQVAYLEQTRSNIRKKYIITIQSVVRKFVYRKRYLRLQRTCLGIQTYSRGLLARRKAQEIREHRAAVTIQKYYRGWMCRKRFNKLRYSIQGIQQYARGLLARQKFKVTLSNHNATKIQRLCRGYLARKAYHSKLKNIVRCQAAIRAFLARRLYKKLKAEARTISHIQKLNKGYENKIISLQQKIDELNKSNNILKTKSLEIPELRMQCEAKKKLEHEIKVFRALLQEKDFELTSVNDKLGLERTEKLLLINEKKDESLKWKEQQKTLRNENDELKRQVELILEKATQEETSSVKTSRLLSDAETDEVYQGYQKIVEEKENLEKENDNLKEENKRLLAMNGLKDDVSNQIQSFANEQNLHEEDFGYSSVRNTLEHKPKEAILPDTKHPIIDPTAIILKLRKILEDEKRKTDTLTSQIARISKRNKSGLAVEDSLRVSELEVENEKMRHDYELLRNSIQRNVESQELEAQHKALQEELIRRRDECIQLKAVLADQSQSFKNGGYSANSKFGPYSNQNDELRDAFEAQKSIARQLECELTSLKEEYNAQLAELNKQIDELRAENNELRMVLIDQIESATEISLDKLKQNERFLKHEVFKITGNYVLLQEELELVKKHLTEITKDNNWLHSKLRENGIMDTKEVVETNKQTLAIKMKSQKYHGIFKHRREDLEKIFQRLVSDLTPRIAISLLPGLPAYIILMCIRYTDSVNADQHVRDLLTQFVVLMKKAYRLPNTTECRVLWLVNTLNLYNLLKQYGGIDEYIKLNTEIQNQQQLKNFDLSEYRQVIYELITNLYSKLVQQVEELLKPYIVPAILDHDEMSRGRNMGNKTQSLDSSPEHTKSAPEPKSLVNQLDHFFKQFQYFGLDLCYIEQIFKQFFNYICAIAMNSLMLRGELCVWKTGMQIRYNISCLEAWARKKNLPNEVVSPLNPLMQVSSLLQARKNEGDVQSIYELCSLLNAAQVLKIIKSYNPDDYEENRISNTFIQNLAQKLNNRGGNNHENDKFTVDENAIFPLKVIYKHSNIKLEEIELTKSLNLDDLLTKC